MEGVGVGTLMLVLTPLSNSVWRRSVSARDFVSRFDGAVTGTDSLQGNASSVRKILPTRTRRYGHDTEVHSTQP